MKLLKELLFELEYDKIIGDIDVKIKSIHFNSSQVVKLSLFVANKGVKNDGHNYIVDAISCGATVIVCEKLPINIVSGITYVKVADSSYALGIIASNFFNKPSKKIKLIGITGTNGKTSTTYYLTSLFSQNHVDSTGCKVGMISTIENQIHNLRFPTTHTTPDAVAINKLLSEMVDAGCEYCFMEVSSHAICQQRISGLDFDIAVFTNLTRDHLDYHKSFKNYLNVKKSFFDQLSPKATAIVNFDDDYGLAMLMDCPAGRQIKYGMKSNGCFYTGTILQNNIDGLTLKFDELDELESVEMNTNLVGNFNAYNLLAAYAVWVELGFSKERFKVLVSSMGQVPGRFNLLRSKDGIIGVVDYAHTPDALSKVINSIGKFCDVKKDLIIVIGCGGNRDVGKRSIMGKIAAESSRLSIFTSDNPRFENPESILDDMCSDLGSMLDKKIKRITNREDAIRIAVESASKGQIILVAGKGHEKYQEIKGTYFPFDDFHTLKKILKI